MRYLFLLPLLVFPCTSGCEYVWAKPVVKRWISYNNVGLELTKRGDRYGGTLFWLSKDGQAFREAFCTGLFDDKNGTIIFPLALRRGGNIERLRQGNQLYVEIPIDFDSDELVGTWRRGMSDEYERLFEPYEG